MQALVFFWLHVLLGMLGDTGKEIAVSFVANIVHSYRALSSLCDIPFRLSSSAFQICYL
jgi:hypothetical protein